MSLRRRLPLAILAVFLPSIALGHGHYGGHAHHGGSSIGTSGSSYGIPFTVGSGGWAWYGSFGSPFGFAYSPAYVQPAPLIFPIMANPGLAAGPVPPNMPMPRQRIVRQVKRSDPAKQGQLVTIGDRLFRAGNLKRASERYDQAVKADPDAAAPRVRLAQIALVRGQFKESADHIRAALAAEPAFLAKAPDIQTIYAEPADFLRQISKLESHVLIEPGDRDAWLVLGAQFYLSGQTRRASDVFIRLSDRQPDPALAAFLDASRPPAPAEK